MLNDLNLVAHSSLKFAVSEVLILQSFSLSSNIERFKS